MRFVTQWRVFGQTGRVTTSTRPGAEVAARHRPWLPTVVGLGGLVILTLAIFVLPEPALTLEYLKVLVWPTVVGVFLYWAREPLRAKVEQLLSFGAFGAEARFAATESLQASVTDAVATVLESTGSNQHDDSVSEHLADSPDGDKAAEPEPEGPPEAETRNESGPERPELLSKRLRNQAIERRLRRMQEQGAIESIMRESAAWGFQMAQLGFKTVPVPIVEWTDDGRPIIKYARGGSVESEDGGKVVRAVQALTPNQRDELATLLTRQKSADSRVEQYLRATVRESDMAAKPRDE